MSDQHLWVCLRNNSLDATDLKNEFQYALNLEPEDVSVAEMDTLRRAVWAWTLTAQAGVSNNAEVLARILTGLGFPCPDDMDGKD
jgi:hypothetical protein